MITTSDNRISLPGAKSGEVYLDCCPVCESVNIVRCEETYAQMHPVQEAFHFDQCKDCDVVFLNPRVAPEHLHRYYNKYYLPYRGADAWGSYAGFVRNSQRKLDKSRAKLAGNYQHIDKKSLVLDIGCGQPTFLRACRDRYQCNTLGIDFSNHGWQHDGDQFNDLDLKVAQIKDLSPSVRPDVITMWHYLEHDYEPLRNLSRLRELAKPNTTLIIEVPNYDSESRKKYGRHWAGYHTPRHTFLFSPRNLQLLLEKAGWQAIDINTRGTLNPYNLYWMSEMEKRGIDWKKDMTSEFWPYLGGMIGFRVKHLFAEQKSLGIMVVVAKVNS